MGGADEDNQRDATTLKEEGREDALYRAEEIRAGMGRVGLRLFKA
jgi:hypothetical protein